MYKRKGFTLIELLVVIAIIALLMSILMPALQRVKKQAKTTICQAHLNQWGLVWSMYCQDNNGYFPKRIEIWHDVVKPFYTDDKICFCPMAAKLESEGGRWGYCAWEFIDTDNNNHYAAGSYGLNQWVLDTPKDKPVAGRREHANMWRTTDVPGANFVPLFLGCVTIGATVWPEDRPPEFDGDYLAYTGNNYDEMKRVCMNRHDGSTNSLFLDSSVRKVGLKELWTLKWHRNFDTAGRWTKAGGARSEDWPEWMRHFKDY